MLNSIGIQNRKSYQMMMMMMMIKQLTVDSACHKSSVVAEQYSRSSIYTWVRSTEIHS